MELGGESRIVPLEERHLSAVQRLWDYCFNRGVPGEPADYERLTGYGNETFVVEEGRAVLAAYVSMYLDMVYDSHTLPMSAIQAVAVAPAARGQGLAHRMMRHAVQRAHERGMPVSVLWAFSLRFYRELGWELVGRFFKFTIPLSEIPRCDSARRVREIEATPCEELVMLQSAYARRYRGACLRPEYRWQRKLREIDGATPYVFVYDGENGPEGYMFYRLPKNRWDELVLEELVALTPEAHRALLGCLRHLDMQLREVSWFGPVDDWGILEPYDSSLKVSVERDPMMRITDCEALLGLPCAHEWSGEYTIRILDDDWAGGARTYRVSSSEGKPTVENTKSDKAELEMSQRVFAQCFMGDPHAKLLRRSGYIRVYKESAFDAFCMHFPPAVIWVSESF